MRSESLTPAQYEAVFHNRQRAILYVGEHPPTARDFLIVNRIGRSAQHCLRVVTDVSNIGGLAWLVSIRPSVNNERSEAIQQRMREGAHA